MHSTSEALEMWAPTVHSAECTSLWQGNQLLTWQMLHFPQKMGPDTNSPKTAKKVKEFSNATLESLMTQYVLERSGEDVRPKSASQPTKADTLSRFNFPLLLHTVHLRFSWEWSEGSWHEFVKKSPKSHGTPQHHTWVSHDTVRLRAKWGGRQTEVCLPTSKGRYPERV